MKTHESAGTARNNSCCSVDDIEEARRVASRLDIPFYPFNFTETFGREVIDSFVREYGAGRTPNPCVLCNQKLKFEPLLKEAKRLGAYHLATGHYVRKTSDGFGRYHLFRAADASKDQSYFLFHLTNETLEHLLFPVGGLTKEQVRSLASEAGLPTADKPESQEICFVPDRDAAKYVAQRLSKKERRPGNFVDREGEIVGRHDGIHAYTIGQRRGLGLATGEAVYVSEIRPATGEVVVGDREALMKKRVDVSGLSFVAWDRMTSEMAVEAKIRSQHPAAPARLTLTRGGKGLGATVEFENPQRAVTPGQAIVFYRDQELLGGGWIERAH